jgi:hypothetical protein
MPIKSLEAILWDENFAFFLLVYETLLFTPRDLGLCPKVGGYLAFPK